MGQVLIIDDDEHITRLLETHLTDEGHHVTVTHDGEEGMAQAEKMNPDLIMLDVFLPDATGYQMCNRLRKNPSTRTTPIIMMTGAARFPNQQMYGRQRGANEYIFKPFNIVEVGELVHKYLKPGAKSHSTNGNSTNGNSHPAEKEDPLASLTSFLEKSQAPATTPEDAPPKDNQKPKIQLTEAVEPLDPFGQPARRPLPFTMEKPVPEEAPPQLVEEMWTPIPKPAPLPELVPMAEIQPDIPLAPVSISVPVPVTAAPVALASTERFIDFGLEIYGMATRMTSSKSELYLGDQLLRTSLAVGAQISESAQCDNREDALLLLQNALKLIHESGYWLMVARKAGLLEALGKSELENTCQSLTASLAELVRSEQQNLK